MAEEEKDEAEQPESKSSIKKLMVPLVAALVLGGASVAALQMFGVITFGSAEEAQTEGEGEGEEGEEAEEGVTSEDAGKPAFFFAFYPDMLVNFTADGQPRYLKLSLDVMSRNEDVIKGVEEYHSIMRNNLLMLFQQVNFDTVNSNEGIAELQKLALEEIRRVLKQYHGENDVEGVYFTSFVVQ